MFTKKQTAEIKDKLQAAIIKEFPTLHPESAKKAVNQITGSNSKKTIEEQYQTYQVNLPQIAEEDNLDNNQALQLAYDAMYCVLKDFCKNADNIKLLNGYATVSRRKYSNPTDPASYYSRARDPIFSPTRNDDKPNPADKSFSRAPSSSSP